MATMRPAVKWHGGKAYLARRILPLLPAHEVYVEPFAGGLSVLLNKPRSGVEVAGDIDRDLMVFYTVLRDQPAALVEYLSSIPYTRVEFERAMRVQHDFNSPINDFERAIRFIVTCRFSRGGLGKTFAWSNRLRGGQPGDVNAWETILGQLPRIAARLSNVQLYRADALEL